jgi:hypothetical protein
MIILQSIPFSCNLYGSLNDKKNIEQFLFEIKKELKELNKTP